MAYLKSCRMCGEKFNEDVSSCPVCGGLLFDAPKNALKGAFSEAASIIGESAQMRTAQKAEKRLSSAEASPKPPKPLTKRQRIKENKRNGVACCPKCGSASLSANKKGFSFVKGAIGGGLGSLVPPVGIVMGLGAGNIGAKKVIITCLNCGHQWKP